MNAISKCSTAATALVVLAVFGLTISATASATVPGQNGKLLVGSAASGWGRPMTTGTMSPAGGSFESLSPSLDQSTHNARFSPDGRTVVFGDSESLLPGASYGVASVDIRTGVKRVLWPSPYPPVDGYGAWVRWDPLSVSPDDGAIALTHFTNYCVNPVDVDPDCRLVEVDPSNGTYVRNLETEETEKLDLGTDAFPLEAIFSPDGRRLAFLTSSDPTYPTDEAIVVLDRRSGSQSRILSRDGISDLAFSPDGRRIAFTDPDGYQGYRAASEVGVVGVDGSGLRQVTDNHLSAQPVFSPDGRFIASTGYFSEQGRDRDSFVQISRVDGSDTRKLEGTPGSVDQVLDWGRKAPFRFLKFKPRKSVAVVRVFGPGKVSLRGNLIARRSRSTKTGRDLRLLVTPRANLRLKKGAKVKISVRFSPTGGLPSTIEKTIRFGGR